MIDREKVIAMTKAAMDESHSRRRTSPAAHFYAGDYIVFQVLKGDVGISLFYLLAVACWALYTVDIWMLYTLEELFAWLIRIGVVYLVILALTTGLLILVYVVRYYQSQRILREQMHDLRKIEHHYEKMEKKRGEP